MPTPLAFPRVLRPLALACLLASGALAGCSTVENLLAGDKVDYKSNSSRRSTLEVPPDLTQLPKDTRYQPASGSVSASTFQTQTAGTTTTTATAATVAPSKVGEFMLERLGNARWIHTSLPPEAVFPKVRTFWKDNGFELVQDRPEAGVVETDWAQNRAKLPGDIIRSTIGKVFDSAYSTGELDKYRTRIERTTDGSDIFVTHRGLVEVYVGQRREQTVWQPRPADPQLEGEFLARLMVKLGAREEQATSTVAASAGAPAGPARARIVADRPAPTLQVDDGFDRAWRRVGIALDRSGFTVEDRDRTQGLYFVRYVDPAYAGREEPGFFSRMFDSVRGKKPDSASPVKYRVKVTGEGSTSTVTVLDSQGGPESGEAGKRISSLLLDDLK